MVRRLFIFAAYDKDNVVDEALMFYLRALGKIGDIVLVMDNDLPRQQLSLLDGVPNLLYTNAVRHGEYDFGSYKRGFMWADDNNILEQYDWVYFVNDSVYGPIGDLESVLNKLENSGCAFVGMLENSDRGVARHVQSWFMGINRKLAMLPGVREFWGSVSKLENKHQICMRYEVGFSELLKNYGYGFVTVFAQCNYKSNIVYRRPYRALRHGVPFIKKSALKNMFDFDFVAKCVRNDMLFNGIKTSAMRNNIVFRRQGWLKRLFK